MRRPLLMSLFLVVFTFSVHAQNTDFLRGYKTLEWGDDIPLAVEKMQTLTGISPQKIQASDPVLITCQGWELAGLPCNLFCEFCGDRGLCQIIIQFTKKHVNSNLYLDDFGKLERALMERYGQPIVVQDTNHDTFTGDSWGVGLAGGYNAKKHVWHDTPKTVLLIHMLYGDNFEVTHMIAFANNALKAEWAEKHEEAPF